MPEATKVKYERTGGGSVELSEPPMTVEEWKARGAELFGDDPMLWKFACSMCKNVASVQDFKDAGAKSPDQAAKMCIGRLGMTDDNLKGSMPKRRTDGPGCDWAAFGLLGSVNGHLLQYPDGKVTDVFRFAE